MDASQLQRIELELTAEERDRKRQAIAETEAAHDPVATRERYDRFRAAAAENSFSGELRRAIQNAGIPAFRLPLVLEQAGIPWDQVEPFLLGEGSLSSDVIDRLADTLKLQIALTASRE
ncbi:MAG: hypothetical protein Q8K78_11890 [Planctomycetaceae bacterium]|nr:hypothetical protein [Planctomycetaceae bacterium]